MDTLLSAESLLLTLIGIFYGLWYPEIIKSLDINIPKHLEDAEPQRKTVKSTLFLRSWPLTIMAVPLPLIFIPNSIKIILSSLQTIRDYGLFDYFKYYDTVSTAAFYVNLLSIGVGTLSIVFTYKLIKLKNKLTPKVNRNETVLRDS